MQDDVQMLTEVADDLNQAYLALWEKDEDFHRPESFHYAISVLSICPRWMFYIKSPDYEESDPTSIESEIFMDLGNEEHELVCKRLERLWYSNVKNEQKFYHDTFRLVYKPDIYLKIYGQLFIGEIKTTNEYRWKGTKRFSSIRDIPQYEHYLQLQVEMNLLNLPGILIYFCRENGQLSFHRVFIDKAAMDVMKKRSALVTAALKSGKPPARERTAIINKNGLPQYKQQRQRIDYFSDSKCFYEAGGKMNCCPFFTHCYADTGLDPDWRRIKEGM